LLILQVKKQKDSVKEHIFCRKSIFFAILPCKSALWVLNYLAEINSDLSGKE